MLSSLIKTILIQKLLDWYRSRVPRTYIIYSVGLVVTEDTSKMTTIKNMLSYTATIGYDYVLCPVWETCSLAGHYAGGSAMAIAAFCYPKVTLKFFYEGFTTLGKVLVNKPVPLETGGTDMVQAVLHQQEVYAVLIGGCLLGVFFYKIYQKVVKVFDKSTELHPLKESTGTQQVSENIIPEQTTSIGDVAFWNLNNELLGGVLLVLVIGLISYQIKKKYG